MNARKQIFKQIAQDEVWLSKHPDEDPKIIEQYKERIKKLRLRNEKIACTKAKPLFDPGPYSPAKPFSLHPQSQQL